MRSPKARTQPSELKADATCPGKPEREAFRVFVEEYMANGGNATAAYKASHPRCKSEKAAGVEGHRLLANPRIHAMIATRQQADPRIMTREERQALWTTMANDSKRPDHIRLQASLILGKSQGDFIEQSEIREDVHYSISWEEDETPAPSRLRTRRSR